ncbi:MAG: hypothetical protein ACR2MS_07815 [Weeksellaceae bacterium]
MNKYHLVDYLITPNTTKIVHSNGDMLLLGCIGCLYDGVAYFVNNNHYLRRHFSNFEKEIEKLGMEDHYYSACVSLADGFNQTSGQWKNNSFKLRIEPYMHKYMKCEMWEIKYEH